MRRKSRDSPIDEGERCDEMKYGGGVKFYNDSVVQAVTFAYLIY